MAWTAESLLSDLLARAGDPHPFHPLLLRDEPGYVALVFRADEDAPRYVYKASSDGRALAAFRKEFEILGLLHRRGSGTFRSSVPRPLAREERDGFEGFLVGAFAGARLKDLPPRRSFGRSTIAGTLETVADWLLRYYRAAGIESAGPGTQTGQLLFARPVSRYLALFETTAEERAAIEQARDRVLRADGRGLPVCRGHGDFSPANVIWNRGRIGVIDYEFAFESVSPLDDLFHFLGSLRSSTSATGRTGARRAFFEEVFYGTGYLARAARRTVTSFAGSIGLARELIESLFLLAWVRMAVRTVDLRADALGLRGEAARPDRLWPRLDAEQDEFLPVVRARGGICDNVRQYVALRDRCVFGRGVGVERRSP